MECSFHIWNDTSKCFFDLLDWFRKGISKTVGTSSITSLEPLGANLQDHDFVVINPKCYITSIFFSNSPIIAST